MSRISFRLIPDKEKEETGRLWNLSNKQADFVSMATHQIKTPLAGIKWTLRMLLDGDAGELNTEQREWLEKSFESNERVLSLIGEMLESIRIDEDRLVLEKNATDIVSLFKKSVEILTPLMKERRIDFSFDTDPVGEEIMVDIDAEKIQTAFQNLLENAVRYSDEGDSVKVCIEKETGDVKISIKDSGIGIPATEKTNIFSRFFRASNAAHYQEKGSGLGLFIAKGIIEKHGGKIWFESGEQKGTTFYFIIPTT